MCSPSLGERRREGQTLIGFAAEHGGDLIERARGKLERKHLDAIVCQRRLRSRDRLRQRRQRGNDRRFGESRERPREVPSTMSPRRSSITPVGSGLPRPELPPVRLGDPPRLPSMNDRGAPEPTPGADDSTYELYRRGLGLLERGDFAAAAVPLAKAAQREPEKSSVREALGRAYFRARRYPEAAEEFEAVVERYPVNDFAHFCPRSGARSLRPPRSSPPPSRDRGQPSARPSRLQDLPGAARLDRLPSPHRAL